MTFCIQSRLFSLWERYVSEFNEKKVKKILAGGRLLNRSFIYLKIHKHTGPVPGIDHEWMLITVLLKEYEIGTEFVN